MEISCKRLKRKGIKIWLDRRFPQRNDVQMSQTGVGRGRRVCFAGLFWRDGRWRHGRVTSLRDLVPSFGAYLGLTSWANVCRPYGAGVWQLGSSVFAQEAGNGELRTAVPGAYPGLASLRQVQGRLWAGVCRPQRVCVGTSGVPPGRGSIYCFPGAERAGLLSAAPPGQESLGLVRLHRPKYSSHADSPRLISLAKEAS